MADEVERDDLYGLELDQFTRQRDLLVARLKAAGAPDEASEIAKLRRPTVDVWALNQVARQHSDLMEALVEVHGTLRGAPGPEEMRKASEERARLMDTILDRASEQLEKSGHSGSGPVRDRMSRSLLAAAGDPETERSLVTGTLQRTAEISIDWLGFSTVPSPASPPKPTVDTEEMAALESRAEELANRAAELRRAARHAREAVERARAEAERADQEARQAEAEAKKAAEALKSASRRR